MKKKVHRDGIAFCRILSDPVAMEHIGLSLKLIEEARANLGNRRGQEDHATNWFPSDSQRKENSAGRVGDDHDIACICRQGSYDAVGVDDGAGFRSISRKIDGDGAMSKLL